MPRRAFTILELIITVGLIVLIASLLVVALGGVRSQANNADSMNTMRRLTLGYNAYSADNKQRLLPGYVDGPTLEALRLSPEFRDGQPVDPLLANSVPNDYAAGELSDASSYLWRLAPYLEHDWETFTVDYRNKEVAEQLAAELEGTYGEEDDDGLPPVYGPATAASAPVPNLLGVARVPAFGLNSIFLGGDNVHGGSSVTDRNPWTPASLDQVLAATRYSEVRNPSQVTVFAPNQAIFSGSSPGYLDTIVGLRFGFPELRPPFLTLDQSSSNPSQWTWDNQQWEFDGQEIVVVGGDYAEGGGIPLSRWGKLIPIAHLDGSVETREPEELATDMRLWSPFETTLHRTGP